MKGKANYCEMRDISGTVCTPMAHLAYLRGAKCSAHLAIFYCPRQSRGYCQIIKKTETDVEIVFLFIPPLDLGGWLIARNNRTSLTKSLVTKQCNKNFFGCL